MKSRLRVTASTTAIRQVLREALATTPGITQHGRDDKQMDITVPSRLPINPSDQAATQLHTQRPPVEDPEFEPANPEELGKALDSLAALVPAGLVGKFYREFVSMIDKYNLESEEDQSEA